MNFSMLKKMLQTILPSPMVNYLVDLKYKFSPKIPDYKFYINYVKGKTGIEIGGPSALFRSSVPLYPYIENLDGVNFSHSTVWEGHLNSGENYCFGSKKGFQYISDGTDLSQISSNTYDFVLSSNCLEHIANPLKALSEWKRILCDKGAIILILPNKASNFDNKRPFTSLDHLIEDYNNNTSEYDLTHLNEILCLHDLSLDPLAGDFENFRRRSLKNFENRCLHHHVFDLNCMKNMFNYFEMRVVKEVETKENFVILALKNS